MYEKNSEKRKLFSEFYKEERGNMGEGSNRINVKVLLG